MTVKLEFFLWHSNRGLDEVLHAKRSTPTLKRLDKQKYTLVYSYTLLLITTASISINAFNGNELIPMVVRAGNGVSILQLT